MNCQAFLSPLVVGTENRWHRERSTSRISATAAGTNRQAFGRAVTPPRRVTGHYELRRAGIPEEFIRLDNQGEAGFAGMVGLVTGVGLLTPLLSGVPVEGPLAGIIGSLMGIWAIDTFALNSVLGKIVSSRLQNRRKVAVHEAGHFVVGYLLGARVKGYQLGDVVKGVNGGVEIECNDGWVATAAGLGGVAAELVEYGHCVGAEEDLKLVGKVVKEMDGGQGIVRWGLLAGYRIVHDHRDAVTRVADVMIRGGDVQQCFQVIEDCVDVGKLQVELA